MAAFWMRQRCTMQNTYFHVESFGITKQRYPSGISHLLLNSVLLSNYSLIMGEVVNSWRRKRTSSVSWSGKRSGQWRKWRKKAFHVNIHRVVCLNVSKSQNLYSPESKCAQELNHIFITFLFTAPHLLMKQILGG